jgi:Ras-related protein Rab-18
MENINIRYKIVVVGDVNTGKTSLLRHFYADGLPNHNPNPNPRQATGDEYKKVVYTEQYGGIEFTLCDTSGMERCDKSALTQGFYRGAHGVLLVFDVTRRDTFDSLFHTWLPRLREFSLHTLHQKCRFVIIGNKIDLSRERQVSAEEAIGRINGLAYAELCAITSDCTTVRRPFIMLAQQLAADGVGRVRVGDDCDAIVRLDQADTTGPCCHE